MKLHRDLGITQKSAWHMAHRIRKALQAGGLFAGPVEVDETYLGGKRKNMSKHKRAELEGRGAVGKTAVIGAKDRPSNQIAAQVVRPPDTLQGFVSDLRNDGLQPRPRPTRACRITKRSSTAWASTCAGKRIPTAVVLVHAQARYNGTYWRRSEPLRQGVQGRHNVRAKTPRPDGGDSRSDGFALRYKDLIKGNGLSSGARAS